VSREGGVEKYLRLLSPDLSVDFKILWRIVNVNDSFRTAELHWGGLYVMAKLY
jgi:hypothetical protein